MVISNSCSKVHIFIGHLYMMGTYTTEFTICSEVGVAEDQDTQSTVNQHSSLTSRPAFLYSLCRMELKCN